MDDFFIAIQARMSSARFPGKVLAPLHGQPILRHVVRAVAAVVPADAIVVATSDQASDDPVAAFAVTLGVAVVRGPLDDVVERFRMCVRQRPSTWIGRVSADSPLLSSDVLARVLEARHGAPCDLVTTVFPRTFPRGQNVELIRTAPFMALPDGELTADDREHVTKFFYRNASRFAIRNVESGDPRLADISVAVDTLEDLRRLEQRAPAATV